MLFTELPETCYGTWFGPWGKGLMCSSDITDWNAGSFNSLFQAFCRKLMEFCLFSINCNENLPFDLRFSARFSYDHLLVLASLQEQCCCFQIARNLYFSVKPAFLLRITENPARWNAAPWRLKVIAFCEKPSWSSDQNFFLVVDLKVCWCLFQCACGSRKGCSFKFGGNNN